MITVLTMLSLIVVLQTVHMAWWWIIIIPFFAGLMEKESAWRAGILNGFATGILWAGVSLYHWFHGGTLIVTRVKEMMQLGSGWQLILITALIAFIVSANAGYTGFSLRRLLVKEYQLR